MFFTKKALIRPIVEQSGSSVLSKIKSQIRIHLATPLKTGLFHGRNSYCVWGWGEEIHFCLKTTLKDFFVCFSAGLFGHIQLQIRVKTTFYAHFLKF